MFQDIAPHRFSNVSFKDAIHPEDVLLCYNGSHVPVSYTHLDVYKRQGPGHRRGPAGAGGSGGVGGRSDPGAGI